MRESIKIEGCTHWPRNSIAVSPRKFIADAMVMRYLSPKVMFHDGTGEKMDMEELALQVIRPAVAAMRFQQCG
jgi:hypothetical protein